jgi:pimeloyl-ACP methyl ester carboxylesterase
MASFERDGATIHYDVEGDGFPVLLIAPGGMRSSNDVWTRMPWNPRAALAGSHTVIGMDQRNAGRSTAPVSADDGWATYTADQLALLDHLGIEECHVLGMCIGGPYIVGLLRAAPQRFRSAVMLQPVGIDDNRHALEEMFDEWAAGLRADHTEVDEAGWSSFRTNMWGGEFVLTGGPDDVAAIDTPILLLKGDDLYHPAATSEAIAAAAPNVTYVERWKDDEVLGRTDATIKEFLAAHTP